MSAPRYTCRGSVRPDCGVKHRSLDTAFMCLLRERAAVGTQGGRYSDRRIVHHDGTELSDDESEALLDALDQA